MAAEAMRVGRRASCTFGGGIVQPHICASPHSAGPVRPGFKGLISIPQVLHRTLAIDSDTVLYATRQSMCLLFHPGKTHLDEYYFCGRFR